MTAPTPPMEPPVDRPGRAGAQTVVCTLGMHRSGTSLVSRIMNLLGVYLGAPAAIDIKAPDNPTGYWEHHPIALVNDEILTAFGGRWDEPPAWPAGWPADPRLDPLRDRARRILATDFAASPVWGWKDPRTCLTLPFWQDLIGPIRYVICVRNPSEVVASLAKRDRMSVPQAERLWLTYVGASLAHTSGRPRLFVFYDDLIRDWAPELVRLATFIGHPARGADPAVQASVGAHLAAELRHHQRSIADLLDDAEISFPVKSLYLVLRRWAAPDVAGAPDGLDLFAAQAMQAADRAAETAATGDRRVRELREQAAAIADLRAEGDRLTRAVLTLSAERGRLVSTLAAVRADRDQQANAAIARGAERDRLATDGAAAAERAAIVLQERDVAVHSLQAMEASRAWRLVAWLRRVKRSVFPPG